MKPKDFDFNHKFETRFTQYFPKIKEIFTSLYKDHKNFSEDYFLKFENIMREAHSKRPTLFKKKDNQKMGQLPNWICAHDIVGYCLYVDRFNKDINGVYDTLDYFEELGVNLLHLMPIMKSPKDENDGGYAVSNFEKVDSKFGTDKDLKKLISGFNSKNMYLMLDIVLNHTSNEHEWAQKAIHGEQKYQDYYYFFDDYAEVEAYNHYMPEIFPSKAPGSFTYIKELNKHVMTVFHNYQWDLNYANPEVFLEMLQIILNYSNLGVDVLRIDAPAFIWKEQGTSCQNLPKAHLILQLIKLSVVIATPGMALLAEAIVAPHLILPYFGHGTMECDLAYNATQMALQWDALATGNTRIMEFSQPQLQLKPLGTSWINYVRCHDDIGLGFSDSSIEKAGFNPMLHRNFLKDYYSGKLDFSWAAGALFSFNPKTNDARISGSLASLCGLEKSIEKNDRLQIQLSLSKMELMLAQCLFLGGIPMLYYGDELGLMNDYSYLNNPAKSYDNRWMHRPFINLEELKEPLQKNMHLFDYQKNIKYLIKLRKSLPCIADTNNIHWLSFENSSLIGFRRFDTNGDIIFVCNYSNQTISGIRLNTFFEKQISILNLITTEFISTNEPINFLGYQYLICKVH